MKHIARYALAGLMALMLSVMTLGGTVPAAHAVSGSTYSISLDTVNESGGPFGSCQDEEHGTFENPVTVTGSGNGSPNSGLEIAPVADDVAAVVESGIVGGIFTYTVSVSWGDSTAEPIEADFNVAKDDSFTYTFDATHSYADPGSYEVTVTLYAYGKPLTERSETICIGGPEPATGTVTLMKNVINDGSGDLEPRNFDLRLLDEDGNDVAGSPAESGDTLTVPAGWYRVTEYQLPGYEQTGLDCGESGMKGDSIYVEGGASITCTITNDDTGTGGNGGGGGGGGRSGGHANPGGPAAAPQGEVLGASTTCAPLLTDYLRIGKENDAAQVKLLQEFLNGELGLMLPISGFFGQMTEKAVEQFQLKYAADVLKPWYGLGLPDGEPTGYVYKTTLWKINQIHCDSLNQPQPQLP